MHKNIIFILFSFSCIVCFGDQTVLIGGIKSYSSSFLSSTLSKKEKDENQKKVQLFKQSIYNVAINTSPQLIALAGSEFYHMMKVAPGRIGEVADAAQSRNKLYSLYLMNLEPRDYGRALKVDRKADELFNGLKNDFSRRITHHIPGQGFKIIAGAVVSQKLSNNVYKQIVYKHIVHGLVDSTALAKNFDHCACQALRDGAIEVTSWALTEYIFDQMEKTGYDPFKLPPHQLDASEILHLINPILKNCSKVVVNAILASYMVAPGYDMGTSAATTRLGRQISVGLTFNL